MHPGSIPGEASTAFFASAVAMTPPVLPRHGGDLAHATRRFGEPSGGWLDLSTGINPHPYPAQPGLSAELARLPGTDALLELVATARKAYDVPVEAALAAVPGTEIALRLLPHVAPAGPVAIVGPTYGSHAEAWRGAGRAVVEIDSINQAPPEASVVVLCNPNNPDGRVIPAATLHDATFRLDARSGLLIVDEAFADLTPAISFAPHLDGARAIVLRSFGKFYGLPGLRLGFVAGDPPTIARIATMLGDWPVSGPALAIGQTALADQAWRNATRRRLGDEAARLRSLLARHGLAVGGGTDLFVLVADERASSIHRDLAAGGVWTRIFAGRPNWLRIGIPPDAAAFVRLDAALATAMSAAASR